MSKRVAFYDICKKNKVQRLNSCIPVCVKGNEIVRTQNG